MEIPAALSPDPSSEIGRSLDVAWRPHPGGRGDVLDVVITRPDHFLPLVSALELARAPIPEEPPEELPQEPPEKPPEEPAGGLPPEGPLVLSGSLPIWLALTYSRWLRTSFPDRPLGHWDASTGQAVFVHGRGAPKAEPWEV